MTPTIPIRDIIITGENEMIVMRKDDVKTPKIISIIPVLIIFVFIGADIFGIIGTISNKVSYDKAMERAVEVNAVCEEIYNSAYTQNGMSVKYATVSFEYKGKTEKINRMEISSDKSVGDTVTILIDSETGNVLLGFDMAGFVFGLIITGVFLIVGVIMLVSIVKDVKNPKEKIDTWEMN